MEGKTIAGPTAVSPSMFLALHMLRKTWVLFLIYLYKNHTAYLQSYR